MTRRNESRPRVGGLQPVQVLAALIGLVYLAAGIIGFLITGFGNFAGATHSTLWVFSINPLHNLFHIIIGGLGIFLAMRSSAARTYGWLLLAVFGILLLWGLAITGVFAGNPVSGLGNPFAIDTADNWLHLATGLLGLMLAVMPARKKVTAPGEKQEQGRTHTSESPSGHEGRGPRRGQWRRGAAH